MRRFTITMLLCLFISGHAHGQSTQEQLDEIKQQLASVLSAADTVESVATAIANLRERVAQLEAADTKDIIAKLDKFSAELTELRERLAANEERVANAEYGWAGAGDSSPGNISISGGKGSLSLGGFLQTRYGTSIRGGQVTDTGFSIPRARLQALGSISDGRVKLHLEAELTTSQLLDYFVDYRIGDSSKVRFGQFKLPYTRLSNVSVARTIFLEWPLYINNERFPREIGAAFSGRWLDKRLAVTAGMSNGAGPNSINDNRYPQVFTRAEYDILGRSSPTAMGDRGSADKLYLSVGTGAVANTMPVPASIDGVSVNNDIDGDGKTDHVEVVRASLDALMRYQGWELLLEGTFRHERWGSLFSANPGLVGVVGARENRNYITLSSQLSKFMFDNRFLAGIRATHARMPFLGLSGQASVLPVADRAFQGDAVFQFYSPSGERAMTLQYTFQRFSNRDTSDPPDNIQHQIVLEAQVLF